MFGILCLTIWMPTVDLTRKKLVRNSWVTAKMKIEDGKMFFWAINITNEAKWPCLLLIRVTWWKPKWIRWNKENWHNAACACAMFDWIFDLISIHSFGVFCFVFSFRISISFHCNAMLWIYSKNDSIRWFPYRWLCFANWFRHSCTPYDRWYWPSECSN